MILGIDTATSTASVALVENGQLVGEQRDTQPARATAPAGSTPKGNHAEVILPLIQSILKQAETSIGRLSGIAVSIGPGSFTGLRIGLATAKGIAYECDLPIVGVSTLHANAARVTQFDGTICSLLDARKGEVYSALFRRYDSQLVRLTNDALTSIDKALNHVREQDGVGGGLSLFIGDGAKAYEKIIEREFGVAAAIFSDSDGSVAAQVARLAESRFHVRLSDDIGALRPVYLRPSEAETKFGKTHLTC